MADRLRVLVLADAGSVHTERYIAELRRQGCSVLLASLEEGRTTYHRLKRRGPFGLLWYILAATEVREVIKRFRPHVINPHFVSGYGFMTALAQGRGFAPVVTHAWGSDILLVPQKSIFHRRKTAYALSEATVVVGDSEYLISQADAISRCKQSLVLPWGIERQYLSLHKSDYQLHTPLRIIVPRHHENVYNNLYVVQVLAPLINTGRVEVTFPNFGSLTGQFKLQSTALVGDKLKFYDKLERGEFLKFLAKHDVYLSAAVSDSSPASMLEAMAVGLIPIAPDIPGVQEWLTYSHGFVYSLYAPEQLTDAIKNIMSQGSSFGEMRERNLRRIKEQAVFEDNIARIVHVMRQLAGRQA